ncbi:hypothetical protein SAMN05421640_1884 [Ekhidna lutea]|uniref:Uncharacterized protein n=1 Tax=Ekhidna lutea TaxID=447679 RepID=A0A239J132_EKHLU|nr:hypothetical protein [Ekhidna lutea]SNS98354.1 hypothetical protein SAMN05421640_1884 [Ekhidna lutea]
MYNKLKQAELALRESDEMIASAFVIGYYVILTFGLHNFIQAAY